MIHASPPSCVLLPKSSLTSPLPISLSLVAYIWCNPPQQATSPLSMCLRTAGARVVIIPLTSKPSLVVQKPPYLIHVPPLLEQSTSTSKNTSNTKTLPSFSSIFPRSRWLSPSLIGDGSQPFAFSIILLNIYLSILCQHISSILRVKDQGVEGGRSGHLLLGCHRAHSSL